MKDDKRLRTYEQLLLNRLNDAVPEKHKHREASFRQFLKNELATVRAKLNAVKE
jgi:hypothetical protein